MDVRAEFLSAIKGFDAAKGKQLLREGHLDSTALGEFVHLSARYNLGELVEQLVALGSPVDHLDHLELCPLHYCAAKNLFRAVSVLVYSDAEVDRPDPVGRTPLMIAISFGHSETFNILVEETKNINAVDKNKNSALSVAVAKGAVNFVRVLLEKKAALDLPDKRGQTPLFSAAAQGNGEIFTLLVKGGANIHLRDSKGRTALHLAGALGHTQIVEQLIQAGAEVNSKDADGNNVLHFIAGQEPGAQREQTDSETSLLDSELSDANHPLMPDLPILAPNPGLNHDLMNVLIKSGINMNEQNTLAETPLHLAARKGLQDPIHSLLSFGADPTLKNREGQAAFQIIAQGSELHEFLRKANETFIVRGSPPTPTPTSISIPTLAPSPALKIYSATQTQERDTEGHTPFMLACGNNNIKEILSQLRIDPDTNINQKDFRGRTGLMLAAARGHAPILSFLIHKGVQIELKDSTNLNALSMAISNQHLAATKILIEAGSDVNVRVKGIPVLMLAISKGNLEMTHYLLEKGALILEKDYRGASAIEYALASKSQEMLELVKNSITPLLNTQVKNPVDTNVKNNQKNNQKNSLKNNQKNPKE